MIGHAPFLGQVRLVPYPNYRLGQSAAEGCTLLGFQVTPFLSVEPELKAKIDQAKASGLQIVEVPSSRSRSSLAPPGTITTADMVPGTEIWACPATWRSRYPKFEPPRLETPPTPPTAETRPMPAVVAAPSAAEFPTTTVLAVGGLAVAGLIAFLALR